MSRSRLKLIDRIIMTILGFSVIVMVCMALAIALYACYLVFFAVVSMIHLFPSAITWFTANFLRILGIAFGAILIVWSSFKVGHTFLDLSMQDDECHKQLFDPECYL